MKFKILWCIVIVCIQSRISGQVSDFQKKTVETVTDWFAETRPLNLEVSHFQKHNFETKNENTVEDGNTLTNLSQLKLNTNLNLIRKEKWMAVLNSGYTYTISSAEMNPQFYSNTSSINKNYLYHYNALTFLYFSKLWNKPAIFSSNIAVDGSGEHFERIKGMVSGVLVLKADANTKMTVGLIAVIDPSVQLPVVPVFTYEKKLSKGWGVEVIMPQRVLLKKNIGEKTRLSLGTEIGSSSVYLYNFNQNSKRYEYRQMELNSRINYEQVIGKNMILSLKTGFRSVPRARIFEKQKSFSSYEMEIHPDATFYMNLGLSFNPFKKANQ